VIVTEILVILMFLGVCGVLMAGFPVAFSLGGAALMFAGIATLAGEFDSVFFGFYASRIFGQMTNEVLIAVPLFVFMGVMLERSKVAEDLLENMPPPPASSAPRWSPWACCRCPPCCEGATTPSWRPA
jgi:TRAP-type mannitol/chloroaromatic compound transport system permease large subunit